MRRRKVCVVGGGAREHALAAVLARSADVIVTPGNPGMDGTSPSGGRITSVVSPPEELDADLFVVGPEQPLAEGLADRLRARGATVFGPGANGARLEASKAYMKWLCGEAGVPTADWGTFERLDEAVAFLRQLPGPYVVKTDGLAAGKGVLVTEDLAEAEADVATKLSGDAFGEAGRRVVVEEALVGREVSLLVLCDGSDLLALAPAQDHKRLCDSDRGPNTGGMGAFSPVPGVGEAVVDDVLERIVAPTLHALRKQEVDYRGVLYAGVMLTAQGPKLVEYNVRFGDPEAEVVLPRLAGDLGDLLASAAQGRLIGAVDFVPDAAVCVVAAAAGYPGEVRSGDPITGLEQAGSLPGVAIYHAGTRRAADGSLVTSGGRVLALGALAPTAAEARRRAYAALGCISFAGMQFRTDIATGPGEPRPPEAPPAR